MFTNFSSLYNQVPDFNIKKLWANDFQDSFLHLTLFFKTGKEKSEIVINMPPSERTYDRF